MSAMVNELRFALRQLLRNPTFTLVSVVTLGLAIGANGALFSLVDVVLLKPLPFQDPERIVAIWDSSPNTSLGEKSRVSSFNYHQWKEHSEAFEAMALYGSATFAVVDANNAVQVSGTRVSEDYFKILGMRPFRGRVITTQDFVGDAAPVTVLSHALWTSMFGADENLIGAQLKLDGTQYTVVGVLPPNIVPVVAQLGGRVRFSDGEHLWVAMNPVPNRRSSHVFGVLGRLREGAPIEQAREQLALVAERLAVEHPDTNQGFSVRVFPLLEEAVGMSRRPLLILLGAVVLVLLIACLNVINLTLVRADGRSRELAVRASLGAGRGSLIRQFVIEGCVLSFAGGVVGLALAFAGIEAVHLLAPTDIPRVQDTAVDLSVAAVTFGAALLAGVLFGVIPAMRAHRVDLQDQLREGRDHSSGGAASLRRALLVGEVALAVVLVTGSGLLIKSFDRILQIDLGFAPSAEILRLDFLHNGQRYSEIEQLAGFYDRLFTELRRLPGVESVAASYDSPLETNWTQGFRIVDAPPPPPNVSWSAHFRTVTPGYFELMNIPLIQGRTFREGDTTDSRPGAVVINQSFARRFFDQVDPLGRELRISTTQWMWGEAIPQTFQIVGVVKDVRFTGIQREAVPAFYLPYLQTPQYQMSVLVRSHGPPEALLEPIRARLREIDPEQPIATTSTLSLDISSAVSQPRFSMTIFSGFAAAALLLALVGLWGLVSEIVRRSHHEIGVRMAIGASASRIFGWTLRRGVVPTLIGIALGMIGAVLAGHLLRSLLYETSPLDPMIFLAVPVSLLILAFLCCTLPAFRAARTNPASVLRNE